MFNHEELFAKALQISDPLYVKSVSFDQEEGELHIHIDFRKGARFKCPVCEEAGMPVQDTVKKPDGNCLFSVHGFRYFRMTTRSENCAP